MVEQTFPAIRPVRGRKKQLVQKARSAALAAVGAYNNPTASFRSGTFVVLMHVAWTSLLLAVLHRDGVKPYYRKDASKQFERVDGRPKVWELRECMRAYWKDRDDAISQNLRFIIGLRNLIEHSDVPEIDLEIFGECQALLMNFEDLLEREFGAKYSLTLSLAFSLQFSRATSREAQDAIRRQLNVVPTEVRRYVDAFRGALSTEILEDMRFSHKVFLVPMVGNHRSKDALAVEFVPYNADDPDQSRVVALVKARQVPVANLDLLKAGEVISEVQERLRPKPFHINLHAAAWRKWRARPAARAKDPSACDARFCVYDRAHKDYLYTRAWVEFLCSTLADDEAYQELIAFKRGDVQLPNFMTKAGSSSEQPA